MEGNKAFHSTSFQGMMKPYILIIKRSLSLLPAVVRAVAMNCENFNVKGEYLNFALVRSISRRIRRA